MHRHTSRQSELCHCPDTQWALIPLHNASSQPKTWDHNAAASIHAASRMLVHKITMTRSRQKAFVKSTICRHSVHPHRSKWISGQWTITLALICQVTVRDSLFNTRRHLYFTIRLKVNSFFFLFLFFLPSLWTAQSTQAHVFLTSPVWFWELIYHRKVAHALRND